MERAPPPHLTLLPPPKPPGDGANGGALCMPSIGPLSVEADRVRLMTSRGVSRPPGSP